MTGFVVQGHTQNYIYIIIIRYIIFKNKTIKLYI